MLVQLKVQLMGTKGQGASLELPLLGGNWESGTENLPHSDACPENGGQVEFFQLVGQKWELRSAAHVVAGAWRRCFQVLPSPILLSICVFGN